MSTVYHSVHLTIFGGLPVTVEYSIEPADPSVGIWGGGVEDWHVVAINERRRKVCPEWLQKRLDNDPKEVDRIMDAIADHHQKVLYGSVDD